MYKYQECNRIEQLEKHLYQNQMSFLSILCSIMASFAESILGFFPFIAFL